VNNVSTKRCEVLLLQVSIILLSLPRSMLLEASRDLVDLFKYMRSVCHHVVFRAQVASWRSSKISVLHLISFSFIYV